MADKTFVFIKDDNRNTYGRATFVASKELFDSSKGYGFVTEENRCREELLQISELNSGFIEDMTKEVKTCIHADENGCYVDNGDIIPLIFKADVLRLGNYELSLTIFGKGEISVFSGCRNLVFKGNLEEWCEKEIVFDMKLISIIPNKKTCMYENRSVDIALLGENVRIKKLVIKEIKCPTLFIAGDSYISNHTCGYPIIEDMANAGWGQMLPVCVNKGLACFNFSINSLSVESFRQAGHFSLAQAHMKLGDYLLLHFAAEENEQKLNTYIQGITEYIEESRAMGIYPILVAPVSSYIMNEKRAFAGICKELSVKLNVPCIDLHNVSDEIMNNNDTKELRDFMALEIAKAFCRELKNLTYGAKPDPYTKLAKYFL